MFIFLIFSVCLLVLGYLLFLLRKQKRRLSSLLQTRKLHELLLAQAEQGIYGVGPDGLVTFVNPAAEQILGYSAEQILGKKMHALIHANHADGSEYCESECPLNLTLSDGQTRKVEGEVFWHANQSGIYVNYTVAALHEKGDLTGGVVMFSDVSELKKKQDLLAKSENRLRRLNQYQEQLREQERRHIAREVHDELGQLLTALRMDTAMLKLKYAGSGAEFDDDVTRMKSTIDSSIAAVRQVASSLRPAALDMGLLAAADWLLLQFRQRSGLEVIFNRPDSDELHLDDAIATAVFRVIQESLTNALRHAKASEITLTIITDGLQLLVSIQDNGQGFDPAEVRKNAGFGLMGIRERVMAFGGTAAFDSQPGQGTDVRIRIPLTTTQESSSL